MPCAPPCSSPLSLDSAIATRARDAAQLSSTAHSAQPPGRGSRSVAARGTGVWGGNFGCFSCGPYSQYVNEYVFSGATGPLWCYGYI